MPAWVQETAYQPFFAPYKHQVSAGPGYILRSGDLQLGLAHEALWLTIFGTAAQNSSNTSLEPGGVNLKISFPGSNPQPQIEPLQPLAGRLSILKGDQPEAWQQNHLLYSAVRYRDLYPGVDLVIQASPLVSAGAPFSWWLEGNDPAQDSLDVQIEGSDSVVGVAEGYRIRTPLGEFLLPTLQYRTHRQQPTWAVWRPSRLANPERQAQAGLIYSTFLGGDRSDAAYDLALGPDGSIFVVGNTPSTDFPTTPGVFDRSAAETDVFVARFNPGGSGLAYVTLLGGKSLDRAYGLALEGKSVYLTGETLSTDFPTSGNALDATCGNNGDCDAGDSGPKSDAFLAKLSPDGSMLVYGTYLGGSDEDTGYAVAYEAPSVYLTGITFSQDFPASGYAGLADVFAVRFDQGYELGYATLIGGSDVEAGFALKARSGRAFITGETFSADFPGGGYQGGRDAFLAQLNPSGSLETSAILGGAGDERGVDLALDGQGKVYIAGWTGSTGFPVTYGRYAGGGSDAFVARFTSALQPEFVTMLGGAGLDEASSIAVSQAGWVFLAGSTNSSGFTTTSNALQEQVSGGLDAFALVLDLASLSAPRLVYSTLLGGAIEDRALALAAAGENSIYLAGHTRSADFPTTQGALSANLEGPQDAFVTILSFDAAAIPLPTPPAAPPTSTPVAEASPSPTAASTSPAVAATSPSAAATSPSTVATLPSVLRTAAIARGRPRGEHADACCFPARRRG